MFSYRISAAWAKVFPAFSAIAVHAVMKFLSKTQSGPGVNSTSIDFTSPPCRSTTMHVTLSFDPASTALWQTATAAAPGSFVRAKFSATSLTTSAFGKSPSDTPSQTRSKKSVGPHSKCPKSGFAVTWRSSRPGPPSFLYSASPKPRDTASSPLTRAHGPLVSTVPPFRMMRSLSIGWLGLWSIVNPSSVPPPSTIVPSRRPRSALLSPALITRRRCFPPSGPGGCTMHIVDVDPLPC
mmetsp:Transcript_88300/g.248664  ORF Transcript_88300/g.248664 Transcript_88300/m.248664 type:complete len:238 (+) Transcript_88300:573-1286(+)